MDIPFETGWTVTTRCSEENGTVVIQLGVNNPRPSKIHLLLQAGNGFQEFANTQVGTITLGFLDGKENSTHLILGVNIRDWARSRLNAVVTETNPDLQEAWSGRSPQGVLGRIDVLSISIPEEYKDSTLATIQIEDTSIESTGSENPCIHLLAITIENEIVEGSSVTDVAIHNPTILKPHLLRRFLELWEYLDGIEGPLGERKQILYDRIYARQFFVGGFMFWWDDPDHQNYILVVENGGKANNGSGWYQINDTWSEEKPVYPPNCPQAQEPNGPKYGFGDVWCNQLSVKQKKALGPALEPEFGSGAHFEKATLQYFDGGMMIYDPKDQKIWVLLKNGNWYMFDAAIRGVNIAQ